MFQISVNDTALYEELGAKEREDVKRGKVEGFQERTRRLVEESRTKKEFEEEEQNGQIERIIK